MIMAVEKVKDKKIVPKVLQEGLNRGRMEKRNYFNWWIDKKNHLIGKGAVMIGRLR